jgi:uncharacterized protein YlxP (DUF503 family)
MAHTTIGVCTLYLDLPEETTFNERRGILKSIITRLHHTFNVSAAEITLDQASDTAVIAFAAVSNNQSHANSVIHKALQWVEQHAHDVVITDQEIEIL